MTQISDSTFIHRVRLQNYKSIAACDVELGPLTFLVGPNGAGKSNFLDALRLVSDALRTSLDHAIRERGGIEEVRRRSSGHPTHFGIRLDFRLPDGVRGRYAFKVSAKRGAYEVQTEECAVEGGPANLKAYYRVEDGVPSGNFESLPPAASDRLYLVTISGLPAFRPVYEALSRMGFYSLNPDQIRDLQPPDAGEVLARDGRNIASVLSQLETREPESTKRIEEYLSKVVPGIEGVRLQRLGPKETLAFKQEVAGAPNPWSFLASNMSDGTLRALGVLVALFQSTGSPERRVPLVGIEEPEVALHPSAAAVLMDSLRDASEQRQILVTSHSPDLLDNPNVSERELLAVVAEQNETKIGRLDEAGRSTLREHLYTAGELLRANQLLPDDAARALKAEQLRLFGSPRD